MNNCHGIYANIGPIFLQIHMFRSIDWSLRLTRRMPGIILCLCGFLCVKNAGCSGNKITGQHDFLLQGGAGGKGTWGAIGEVLDEDYFKIQDQHDPNYESEEDENVSKIKTRERPEKICGSDWVDYNNFLEIPKYNNNKIYYCVLVFQLFIAKCRILGVENVLFLCLFIKRFLWGLHDLRSKM